MNKFWQFKNIGESAGELMLYGDIRSEKPWWSEGDDAVYPRQFNTDLQALGNISELTVRINSMGGDVFAANAIYTALKSHAANVTVKIDGIAASAATIIAMAGDSIQAPSNALFMIHDPLLVLWGMYNAEDMKKMSDVLETVKESIVNSYVNKTGRDRAELSDMMKQETWMTADEAKVEGFIDEILFENTLEDASVTNDGKFMVVNSIAHDMSKFKTRPQLDKPVNRKPLTASPVIEANPQIQNKSKESEEVLEIKNIEELKQHFPDLCNQLVNTAAAQERERMKAIDDISATIAPELVNKAKYEDPMTAQNLAFEALKADAGRGAAFVNQRGKELEAANEVDSGKPVDKAAQELEVVDKIAAGANQKREVRR